MKIPYSWLCDFAEFASLEPEGVAVASPSAQLVSLIVDAMNDLGLVVEGVERIGAGLDNVVVAEVVEISAIEGADKIRKVMVRADEKDLVQIVCGAFNFEVGDKVPLAKIGAVLPGDFAIAKRKMRGIESYGMLCSGNELKLGSDQSGLMILPGDLEPGTPIREALGISGEVIFDLAIENNRPDANCVMGVARDLAAWFKIPFHKPGVNPAEINVTASPELLSKVKVVDPAYCDRLVVARFRAVSPSPTSKVMASRLEMAGMRPVSPIVDISNYLMIELGQPTHPYDASRLDGGVISVRLAQNGEKLTTLDGVERVLGLPDARGRESTDLVIADGSDRVVGLAGIMGGAESEITASTTEVLLEIAHFDPMTIARTSKRLGIRSEASARFERGVDPVIIETVLSRFSEMLGQKPIEVIDISQPLSTSSSPVAVRASRVNQLLGTSLTVEQISTMLDGLDFRAGNVEGDVIEFRVPTNRPDVEREVDVIEEIARHYGYRNIEKVRPYSKLTGKLTPKQRFRRQLGSMAIGMGFYEAWSATLLSPGEQELYNNPGPFVEVDNPLTKEESVLRGSLLPGLIRALRFNANRGEREIRFYEIGKVFQLLEDQLTESERVAFLLGGDGASSAMSVFSKIRDFFHLGKFELINHFQLESAKAQVRQSASDECWGGLHPTRSGYLVWDKKLVGVIGQVDPMVLERAGLVSDKEVGYLELNFDLLTEMLPPPRNMEPISPFPQAQVDLAFEVPDSVSSWEIEEALTSQVSKEVVSAALFDVYRGPNLAQGHRSLAFSVKMANPEKTLTDSDISVIREKCINIIEARFKAKLRS